ncbi:MAG: zinc-ribbon domain-containing protein [Candidatus Heimdallarchaeaceae archaeon]|jgi:hypothetical protein
MSGVFCPNCGNKHEKSGKFCQYCGANLEDVIMDYKNDRLPVKYQTEPVHSGPYQQGPEQRTYSSSPSYSDHDRDYRDDVRKNSFFDALCSILFFLWCCGPDCR